MIFFKLCNLHEWAAECHGIWKQGGCNLCFSMQNVIAGRGDQAERGKCLRQVWINMLRQDTEILPLAMFLSPSSLFSIPYYWHFLQCLQQKKKAVRLWFLRSWSTGTMQNFSWKRTLHPVVLYHSALVFTSSHSCLTVCIQNLEEKYV